jgi:hypothetical protein
VSVKELLRKRYRNNVCAEKELFEKGRASYRSGVECRRMPEIIFLGLAPEKYSTLYRAGLTNESLKD